MKASETIRAIEEEIRAKQRSIADIRQKCQHKWAPSEARDPSSSVPICTECAERKFGWWCEAAPDKECDYRLPSGRGHNMDSCRYCGDPEERK